MPGPVVDSEAPAVLRSTEPMTALADDATGAADCAVAFAAHGWRSVVSIADRSAGTDPDAVIVRSTGTRCLAGSDAEAVVRAAIDAIAAGGRTLGFVKIDSTLRGHIGRDVAQALEVTGLRQALIAPAHPRMGRRVHDGIAYVAGPGALETAPEAHGTSPGEHGTALGAVGTAPGEHGTALGAVEERLGVPAARCPLRVVRAGPDAIVALLRAALDAGRRYVVADTMTEADLACLALAAERSSAWLLPVGSGGLAASIAAARLPRRSAQGHRVPVVGWVGPVVVAAGSSTTVAAQQVDHLTGTMDAHVEIVDGRSSDAAAARRAADQLRRGRDVVLRPAVGRSGGATSGHASAKALARLVAELLSTGSPGGLLVCGGDTLEAVLQACHATAFEVSWAPVDGTTAGTLLDGPHLGTRLVTKAGAFGDVSILSRAVNIVRQPPLSGA